VNGELFLSFYKKNHLTTRFSQHLEQFGEFGIWRIFEGDAKRKGTVL